MLDKQIIRKDKLGRLKYVFFRLRLAKVHHMHETSWIRIQCPNNPRAAIALILHGMQQIALEPEHNHINLKSIAYDGFGLYPW